MLKKISTNPKALLASLLTVTLLTSVPVSSAITAEPQKPLQATSTETYSYDAAGRLISITFADGQAISYSYDANGNITSIDVTGGIRIFRDGFESG